MSGSNPTRKDGGLVPQVSDADATIPLQKCPHCKKEITTFFFRTYELPMPGVGTVIYQGCGCPHLDCLTIYSVWIAGVKQPQVSSPGAPGWPGGH